MENDSNNNGWIKVSRRLLDWEWYDKQEMVRLFLHLLLKANIEPKQWHGLTIPVGALVTSRAKLAMETGLSERTIRTCLLRLKTTKEVTIQTTKELTNEPTKQPTKGYSLITICKFETYQLSEQCTDQTNDQTNDQTISQAIDQRSDHKTTTTKEYNRVELITRARGVLLSDQEIIDKFFGGQYAYEIEALCRSLQTSEEILKEEALNVLSEWHLTGDDEQHFDEFQQRKHFINHLRIKTSKRLEAERKNKGGRPAAKPQRPTQQPEINNGWENFIQPDFDNPQ